MYFNSLYFEVDLPKLEHGHPKPIMTTSNLRLPTSENRRFFFFFILNEFSIKHHMKLTYTKLQVLDFSDFLDLLFYS
jgi:hypothetical protein